LSVCLGTEKSQLKAMQVNHLHADNMVPASVHLKTREEKEGRSHPRARRVSSDENSHTKVGGPECHITTIPELSECLEKRLHVHNQKVISMVGKRPDHMSHTMDQKGLETVIDKHLKTAHPPKQCPNH